ncbi:MAG: TonB-dependent receptor [Deltaproteobacteria bacterium]|nr:TonB-dependent receptor [Deltaproteobacteria bacterium]
MLRRAALLACLAAPGVVHADTDDQGELFGVGKKKPRPAKPAKPDSKTDKTDKTGTADDQDDLFGLNRKTEAPPSCDDGRAFGCAMATDPLDPVTPYALRTWLSAKYLQTLPIGDARSDQVATFATGAFVDDTGVAFAGATGLENRWSIEGAPVESARTGNVELRVPVTFIDQLLVIAGGFSARDRVSTGGAIDVQLIKGGDEHVLETRAWLGWTAAPRGLPPIPSTYQVRRLRTAVGPQLDASVVGSGPVRELAGGKTWYAAGIAPSLQLSEFTWKAARLVDADNNGIPDGLPGVVILDPIVTTDMTTLSYFIPAMARAGWDRGPHHVDVTVLANFSHATAAFANATQQAAGLDRAQRSGVAIATWRGTWKDTHARVQAAWHHAELREDAHDDRAARLPKLQSAYVPLELAEEPFLADQCRDGGPNDPTPRVDNCPVPFGFFGSGGAGRLVDSVSDHPTVTGELAHRVGDHVLRAGATLEDTRLVVTSRFTGGFEVRSLFPGHTDTRRFFTTCDPDPTLPCAYADQSKLTFRTRYTAAYLEDTFEPVEGLRVDGGLRWELMWVGPRLHFSDQLAPRFGVAWDPLGKGRSRVFASLGRSYAMLPAGLGSSVIARDRIVADVDAGAFGRSRNLDVGAVYSIARDVKPIAQDEATLGVEVGLARLVHAIAWVQGRTLRRGLETVLVNEETGQFVFQNPGVDGREPVASRDSFTFAFELAVTASKTTTFRAGLAWNRTVGTWPGPFDPRQGTTLYAGTDYDGDPSNMDGILPSDAGGRGYFELVRKGKLAGLDVGASTRLTVASGLPRDVLLNAGQGIAFLLPRGSAGREEVRSQADVRLSARVRSFDLTLDVFDLFNRREVIRTNRIYAGESVRPILGGELSDLVWLKNETGTLPDRRPAFGTPVAFAPPLSILLGVRRAF